MVEKNKKPKAKKIATIIAATILTLCFIAIIGAAAISKAIANRFFPNVALTRQAKTNFEYLKKKEISKLIKQFSDEAKSNHDLEREFENFYQSINGNLVSYEHVNCADREKYVDSWKITKHIFICEFENVQTDTGVIYETLSYSLYRVNNYKPSTVGINVLSIQDRSTEYTVGGIEQSF
jgi:hypothetical protein